MKLISRLALLCSFALILFLSACGGVGGSSNQPPKQDPCGGQPCINKVNHVIIMFQENRSFDDYFGQMTAYRQSQGIPINSSDGKIDDLSTGSFSNQNFTTGQTFPSYHSGSVCTEDLTPDWTESHKMINFQNPVSAGPGSPMNGFVQEAYGISQFALTLNPPLMLADQDGHRAMGYFDDSQLNYYYFMASDFAMGDQLYSPVPSRTAVNRLYIHAATSQGHAHEPSGSQLTAKTIWQELDAAGVTWKIYYTDKSSSGFTTYLSMFTYFNSAAVQAKVVPVSQYLSDVQNGTLPAVAFIETGMFSGRDEHPTNFNPSNPSALGAVNVQTGASYVSSLINALMASPSWKDSVFFLTWDEGGGLFDHVPPINVPSPDGIQPMDLRPGDISGADFTITGFRVPNIIVSPFSKKNFVSHTPMDYTAFLRFIETRWGVAPLTKRDAAMPDMQEFFDFAGAPWATPPPAQTQSTSAACDFSKE